MYVPAPEGRVGGGEDGDGAEDVDPASGVGLDIAADVNGVRDVAIGVLFRRVRRVDLHEGLGARRRAL